MSSELSLLRLQASCFIPARKRKRWKCHSQPAWNLLSCLLMCLVNGWLMKCLPSLPLNHFNHSKATSYSGWINILLSCFQLICSVFWILANDHAITLPFSFSFFRHRLYHSAETHEKYPLSCFVSLSFFLSIVPVNSFHKLDLLLALIAVIALFLSLSFYLFLLCVPCLPVSLCMWMWMCVCVFDCFCLSERASLHFPFLSLLCVLSAVKWYSESERKKKNANLSLLQWM